MDGLGDHHANRVGQPASALGEPGHERMGAAAGVAADQRPPPSPVIPRQLSEGKAGGDESIG